MTARTYLAYAESVKMLRDALKRNFPGVRFSVAKSYQRGTSVRVTYTYGPPQSVVDAVAQRFHGRDFDGMTDSNSYPSSLLVGADGTMREVSHGIGFIFTERDTPQPIFDATVAELGKSWNETQWASYPSYERERIARGGISKITTRPDESPEDAGKRAAAAYFSDFREATR